MRELFAYVEMMRDRTISSNVEKETGPANAMMCKLIRTSYTLHRIICSFHIFRCSVASMYIVFRHDGITKHVLMQSIEVVIFMTMIII